MDPQLDSEARSTQGAPGLANVGARFRRTVLASFAGQSVRKHARKHAVWRLEGSHERSSLEPRIEELVAFVEARRELFTELLTCCRINVARTVFRGDVEVPARLDTSVIVLGCGFELKPELLHRLADLRLGLSFSIY